MSVKQLYVAFGFFVMSVTVPAQGGFCLKYTLVANGSVTDTLQVLNLNGNTLNRLTKTASGQVTYRSLKLKDKPLETYSIYTDDTYRMIPDVQLKDYIVSVMGKEQVNGFNCTKISVVTFAGGTLCYLWITSEIPNYRNYLNASVIDFKLDRLNEALKKNNVAGVPVKIAYKVPDFISYEFVSASGCEVNPSLLDLGHYTNTKAKATEASH